MKQQKGLLTIGWREWVLLPELSDQKIKAKVDSGARTSALHATDISITKADGEELVSYTLDFHGLAIGCRSKVIEHRKVTSSNGETSERPVISTLMRLGDRERKIELTLVNRETMGFPMLLGRTALRGIAVINPGTSYLLGKKP